MTGERDQGRRFPGHDFPQVIPEPDEVRPGGPAPWEGLAPRERRGVDVGRVARALVARGQTAEPPETGVPVAPSALPDGAPGAAVLVALFDEGGEAHVVLTRRARTLRAHRGEVALPGGRREPGESPWDAALREAREEVGLDPGAVTPLGWLTPLSTRVSPAAIVPVVGALPGRPALVAQPEEVERVFTVALSDLLEDGAFVEELWRRDGWPGLDGEGFYPIHFYRVPGELLWGATARILTDLLALVVGDDAALGGPGEGGG